MTYMTRCTVRPGSAKNTISSATAAPAVMIPVSTVETMSRVNIDFDSLKIFLDRVLSSTDVIVTAINTSATDSDQKQ